jgi:hypothetical protein
MIIVSNIKAVAQVILTVDEDLTVCATLEKIANEYGQDFDRAFANGGDQNKDTFQNAHSVKNGHPSLMGWEIKFNRAVGCSKNYKDLR